MANVKASSFSVQAAVYDDTYFPVGEPGNGAAAANKKIAFSVVKSAVVAAVKSTDSVTATGTKAVGIDKWLIAVAVTNSGGSTRTISIGKTAGAGDYIDNYDIPTGTTETFNLGIFGGAAGLSIYLTATGALTLNYLEI